VEYRTLNPATGELLERFDLARENEIDDALVCGVAAFDDWRRTPVDERAAQLGALAERLDDERDELAELMAVEMGKPLAEGAAEATKCASACRYFAEHGPRHLADRAEESDALSACVRHDPLGPILAIMPWNFPLWQFFRFAAPALIAGNSVILKHAPNTPRCALRIEGLISEAGLPGGLVRPLFLSNGQTARVIDDDRVRGVTLTGSTRAGREVGARAGAALKPIVLELGGSDPFIVLEDADLDEAARVGVISRCLNSGQSCIAAKRFLVHESVCDRFLERFTAGMKARVVGDPRQPGVDVGPLAREDLREQLTDQVRRSRETGASALLGGSPEEGPGFFYPPTVLVDVPPESPANRQELFGPVAAVNRFEDEGEALRQANGTRFGLGASLWTSNPAHADRWIGALEAGSVFVNGLVKSDPRLPFGGVKASGFGRELGREGILEFVNVKSVWRG
jgi:succinate-semialdehyde dehydrogenase/glutarate-semialdehyde dehydrogenase